MIRESMVVDRSARTSGKAEKASKVSAAMEVDIPRPQIEILVVGIVGISPYISHKWSEKAKKQIEDKQQKKAKSAREKRDPKAEYLASMYEIPGKKNTYGIPARAFKLAMVEACRYGEGIKMNFAKGAFFVMGDLLTIKGSKPRMREDFVKVPPRTGGADIRYRGEFTKWSVELQIRFNGNQISPEQIMNLISLAGFHVGVGEWRPSSPLKPGNNGMFEIASKRNKK